MRYIYLDNFRGFAETLIPLEQVNFFVGENSTGKSSILKLLSILSSTEFFYAPDRYFHINVDLGDYNDIVSAGAANRDYFQIGYAAFDKRSTGSDAANTKPAIASFSVYRFSNNKNTPVLTHFCDYRDGSLTKVIMKGPRYKVVKLPDAHSNIDNFISLFKEVLASIVEDKDGFKSLPRGAARGVPLRFLISLIHELEAQKSHPRGDTVRVDINLSVQHKFESLTCIAPIRTKPRRFYDGLLKGFSPEGEHTPFVLREQLLKARRSMFVEKLKAFGRESGLFQAVAARGFGKDSQSPFELVVDFGKINLNINNVGYGVSQVLPLLVEFIHQKKSTAFAVQQPEVHLHPRAQAALGELIYEGAKERDHTFFIETHSDYLIDRYRLRMNIEQSAGNATAIDSSPRPRSQVLFFSRKDYLNIVIPIPISERGSYPASQPKEFREFFINESIKMLEV